MNAIQALSQLSYGPTGVRGRHLASRCLGKAAQRCKGKLPAPERPDPAHASGVVVLAGHIGEVVEGDVVLVLVLEKLVVDVDVPAGILDQQILLALG